MPSFAGPGKKALIVLASAVAVLLVTGGSFVATKPWFLTVLHGDVYSALGLWPSAYSAMSLLVNLVCLLFMVVPSIVIFRRRKRSGLNGLPLVAILVLLTLFPIFLLLAYPHSRERYSLAQVADPGPGTEVVLLQRSIYFPENSRLRGLVLVAEPGERLASVSPRGWPYDLLSRPSTAFRRLRPAEMRTLVEALRGASFFEFPQQLDPRSSGDHAALYIALRHEGKTWRTFGRVSHPAYDRLLAAFEAALSSLSIPRDSEWWVPSSEP